MGICRRCGKECDELIRTYDYHGIPYRLVCYECYDEVDEIGYDGEAYSEFDECIDEYY